MQVMLLSELLQQTKFLPT